MPNPGPAHFSSTITCFHSMLANCLSFKSVLCSFLGFDLGVPSWKRNDLSDFSVTGYFLSFSSCLKLPLLRDGLLDQPVYSSCEINLFGYSDRWHSTHLYPMLLSYLCIVWWSFIIVSNQTTSFLKAGVLLVLCTIIFIHNDHFVRGAELLQVSGTCVHSPYVNTHIHTPSKHCRSMQSREPFDCYLKIRWA